MTNLLDLMSCAVEERRKCVRKGESLYVSSGSCEANVDTSAKYPCEISERKQ